MRKIKKIQLLILTINFLFLIIISINPVFAIMESEHYRIQEESINFGKTRQQMDPYQIESKQMESEEKEKFAVAGIQLINFQLPLWKIILFGLAGIFFVVTFFIWLKSIFKPRKKTYNKLRTPR